MLPLSPLKPKPGSGGTRPPTSPSDDPAEQRWATRIAIVALVLIALGVTAYAGRTWIATQVIKAQLAKLGIGDVTLSVSEMNQDGLVIDRIAAEHGAITVS